MIHQPNIDPSEGERLANIRLRNMYSPDVDVAFLLGFIDKLFKDVLNMEESHIRDLYDKDVDKAKALYEKDREWSQRLYDKELEMVQALRDARKDDTDSIDTV